MKFFCTAKSLGVNFTNFIMIGRQRLSRDILTMNRVFRILGIDQDAEELHANNEFGESFFSSLGAERVDSLDYSNYEGATIVHDLNSPIPEALKEKYSAVYDGGSLEHVFDVPTAIKNCMEMVQVGGHFLQITVANNFMGHGFWQFSPDLIFRIFSKENGFEIEHVFLHEAVRGGDWVSVADPRILGKRVELCNRHPTYIITIARRISDVPIFSSPPLQSDYESQWKGSDRQESERPPSDKKATTAEKIDQMQTREIIRERNRMRTEKKRNPFGQDCYQLLVEQDLLRGKLSTQVPESP